jgi:cytochrome b6-f complex iron-sulfur subunit
MLRVPRLLEEFTGRAWLATVISCLLMASPAFAQRRAADCGDCHSVQKRDFQSSVHHGEFRCQQCHGGEDVYELTPSQGARFGLDGVNRDPSERPEDYDHGPKFRGASSRSEIPNLCGECHADVERMNPYGLRTDQLARYWVSGHGKRLKNHGDTNSAVCTDCHGAHDVIASGNAESRTNFRNIPETCGVCHADPSLMAGYGLSPDIVAQYRGSIHGRNLLEHGDAGSPHCATCHGSHGAAPPGFTEVGHVCGQCHQRIEEHFQESVHGPMPMFPRCVGCHSMDGARNNHQIEEATPSPEELIEAYEKGRQSFAETDSRLRDFFNLDVNSLQAGPKLDVVCSSCHRPDRSDPHAVFLTNSDETARTAGVELAKAVSEAQFLYAQSASRVDRMSRGVTIVRDEALVLAEAKTHLMALHSSLHTLNRGDVHAKVEEIKEICDGVSASLDKKSRSLDLRAGILKAAWVFILVFVFLMYSKYKRLRRLHIRDEGSPAAPVEDLTSRRRFFDGILNFLGAVTAIFVLWPAIAYILPARKRGGGAERVSVGSSTDWDVWSERRVAYRGVPVVVLRTEKDFRAFSAVCTHLGCIVRWDSVGRKLECPCHAASFGPDGGVVSGPPPKPLAPYKVSVVDGEVIVMGAAEA